MFIIGRRIKFIFWLILFRCALDFSYVYFVSDVFGYDGFSLNFDAFNYALSWLFSVPFLFCLSPVLNRVRDYTEIFWALLVIFPVLSMYGLNSDNPIGLPLIYCFSFFIFFMIIRVRFIKVSKLPEFKYGLEVGVCLCLLFVILLIINYTKSGVSLNLNFLKVYEFRESNSELSSGGLLTYINIWTYKVFNITLLCLALFYKRYTFAAIIVLFQVYFFAASAHKSVLFMAILVISIWYLFQRRDSLLLVPVSLMSLMLLSLSTFYFFSDITLSSIFIRRLFYIPAQLGYFYYDFFSNNEYVYWSNSILKSIISYPYPESISHTIGTYMGKSGSGANNGLIASGFAHAGIFGVLIYTIVFAFLIKLIDFLGGKVFPVWFLLAAFIVPISSAVLNSDLLTTLSTHGFGVAIFMLYLIRKEKMENYLCSK